jgi:hypothetical protein
MNKPLSDAAEDRLRAEYDRLAARLEENDCHRSLTDEQVGRILTRMDTIAAEFGEPDEPQA